MPYLGNIPATQFAELKYQDFTGGTGTSFTLNDPVGSAQELEVFVNNVRQEPGVAYTVSGTALTMTGSIVASDDFYVVFQGKSVGTATHPAGQPLEALGGTFGARVDVTSGTGNRSASFVGSNTAQNHHIFVDASGTASTTGIKISNSNSNNQSSVYHSGGNNALYVQVGQTSGGETTSGTNVQSWTSSEVCINEGSADVDFRVESDNDTHALFVQGSDGNIGIGESAPLGQVHIRTSDASITNVNGNADELILESNGNCGMSIASSTSGEGNINFIDSGDTNIGRIQYTHTDNFMRFRINDAERYRITSAGRFEFQTPTAETGVLQGQRIDWRNENNAGIMAGIGVVRTAGFQAPGAFVIRTSTNVDSASNNSDGEISEKFRVAPNGDLTATDTSISSNSDQRLKENIADFEYDLTKFKQFQTRTFDWKQPHLHGDKSDVRGFIAQELEAVDSYWVQEIEVQSDSDDYQYLPDTDLQYGPNNNYKPDDAAETDTERTARFAKTSRLGQKDAMYVSVIQQLLTKIEALETENSTQATQIADLITRVTALEDA